MDHLISIGVDRFIVNTHHCPHVYNRIFPESRWRGFPIIFRYEPVLLETAGGLKNIEDLLTHDEAIVCYNGDVMADIPLGRLIDVHERERPDATLVLRSTGPVLNVNLDREDRIVDFRHTLGNPGDRACLFTGIYTVEKSLLQFIEAGRVESIIPVFIRRIVEDPPSVRGLIIDEGEWHDIGSLEAYEGVKSRVPTGDWR
jgi:NDP-sugar pyrophosphorylase family protein